tara:strand:- start:7249 stop:7713 length:465 start_codon:yes stop_codon:yes gene_type:complete
MSSISNDDKSIWENYVSNLNDVRINFQVNKKSHTLRSKNINSRKNIPQSNLKQIKQGKLDPEGILDLHGYRLHTAKTILQKYILDAYEKNLRNILIITGKGHNNSGLLKKEVPLWLNDRILIKFLVNFETAPKKLGGEGAVLVRIKNKKKHRFI